MILDGTKHAVSSFARIAGAVVIFIGVLVLLGWFLDIPAFRGGYPGLQSMKANPAVGFILCGLSLLLALQRDKQMHRIAAGALCSLVAMMGLLTLLEIMLGIDLGFDQMLIIDHTTDSTVHPGRMAPMSGICFMLMTSSIVLSCYHERIAASQALAVAGGFLGILSLTGFAYYHEKAAYGFVTYLQMPPLTAATFILLSIGIITIHEDDGIVAAFTGTGPGTIIIRRLIPTTAVALIGLGWLMNLGTEAGLYDYGFSNALIVLCGIIIISAIVWRNAVIINRADVDRTKAIDSEQRRIEKLLKRQAALIEVDRLDMRCRSSAIEKILQISANALEVDRASLWAMKEEGMALRFIEEYPHNGRSDKTPRHREDHLDYFSALERKNVFTTSEGALNRTAEVRYSGEGAQSAATSTLDVTVRRGGQISAVVSYQMRRGRRSWSAEETEFASTIAGTVAMVEEIADRAVAEQALLESRKEIALQAELLENSSQPFVVGYADGKISRCNEAYLKLIGYTKEEISALSWKVNLTPAEWIPREMEILKRICETGKPERFLKEYLRKDGSKFPIEMLVHIVRNDDGSPKFYYAFITDITARKKAEEELREARDYLESLLNYSNVPMIVWDPSFKITRFNRAFGRLIGIEPSEMIGQPLERLFPSQSLDTSLEEIRQTLCGQHWDSVEIPILHSSGSIRTVLWNSANIYDAGGKRLIATIAQGQDITDRKKAEEELREARDYLESLLNYSNVPMIVWDPYFKITRFNRAFGRLIGIEPSEMIGQPLERLFPSQSLDTSLEEIRQTLCGQRWDSVEIPILHSSGSIRTVLWNSANIYDAGGKRLIATIAQGQDITDRKLYLDMLSKRTEELARSNQELQQFAYVASHDLQEPLRMISSYMQLIEQRYKGRLDPEADEFIGYAVDGAKRLSAMISGLLDYSRIGTKGCLQQLCDSAELLTIAEMNLTVSIRDSGTKVSRGQLPVIYADRPQIIALFQNLISNAIKFRGEETPRVHVSASRTDGFWQFSVEDNGIGIEPQYRERVFVIFRRLHGKEVPGTGIGLAICKRIVERHGGKIWVEPGSQNGSKFCFTLPASAAGGEKDG